MRMMRKNPKSLLLVMAVALSVIMFSAAAAQQMRFLSFSQALGVGCEQDQKPTPASLPLSSAATNSASSTFLSARAIPSKTSKSKALRLSF